MLYKRNIYVVSNFSWCSLTTAWWQPAARTATFTRILNWKHIPAHTPLATNCNLMSSGPHFIPQRCSLCRKLYGYMLRGSLIVSLCVGFAPAFHKPVCVWQTQTNGSSWRSTLDKMTTDGSWQTCAVHWICWHSPSVFQYFAVNLDIFQVAQ